MYEASSGGEPLDTGPVADAPVADAPVADAPVEDAPVEDAPVEDAPVDAPVDVSVDAPVDAPVDDAPEALVDAPPVDASPEIQFTVDAVKNGGCPVGSNPVVVGVLGPGTYRFTYLSGATRTGTVPPYGYWNRAQPGGCGGYRNYTVTSNLGELPGFSNATTHATAAAAEAASLTKYIDFVVSAPTSVRAWYNDEVWSDNQGAITYAVRKLP